MSTTIIGVDLATKAIQVCVYLNSKVLSNKEQTPQQFSDFLRQQTPSSWCSNLVVVLTTRTNIAFLLVIYYVRPRLPRTNHTTHINPR